MWDSCPLVSPWINPLPNMLNGLNGIVRLPPLFETIIPGQEDRRGELHFPPQRSRVFFWKSTPCSIAFQSLNASRHESILPERARHSRAPLQRRAHYSRGSNSFLNALVALCSVTVRSRFILQGGCRRPGYLPKARRCADDGALAALHNHTDYHCCRIRFISSLVFSAARSTDDAPLSR